MSLGKKISELPVATTLTGLELAVVVQTSTTKQSTPEAITASVSSRLDNVVSVNNAALTSINNTVSALEIRVSAVSARASVNAAAITSINAEVSLKAYRDDDFLTNVQYIEFNTTTSYAPAPGRLTWDIESGTLDLGLTGDVNLLVGQRTVAQVYNNSGVTLPRGKAVRVTGAQGQRLTGALALADSDANSLTIFGIMLETVSVNRSGYVATDGLVKNLNTVGYNDGDIVYLSPISAGELTPIKPVSPQHLVQMGYIVNGGTAGAGEIYIKVQNGYELGELHDVKVSASTSLADGEVLAYNVSAQVWTNSPALIETQASISALNIQVAAVSALTSVNAAAITSINNVVSALEVRVSNASAINTTQTAAITSINNVVSALEIRVSNASATNVTQTAAITSINNVVSALEIRVSSVSAAVVSINNVVSALGSAVAAVGVTAINAALTSINAVVSLKVNRSGDTMTGPLIVNVSSASNALRITQTGSGNALVVEDSANPDATPFVVDASGNTVQGNTSPLSTIPYYSTGNISTPALQQISAGAPQLGITGHSSSQAFGPAIALSRASGDSVLAPTAVSNGFDVGAISFSGHDGTGFIRAAQILAEVDGTPGTNDMPGRLVFSTTADGASSPTERMRIDASGNVGIGTSSPGARLDVVGGDIRVKRAADNDGAIYFGTTFANYIYSGNTNNIMAFGVNGSERARITSGGDFQFDSGYGSVATAYGCRAWVNFNGTGTVAIRASGNVSSITDNGTGDYTVNFTNAMPDANYASLGQSSDAQIELLTVTTSSCSFRSSNSSGTPVDSSQVCVGIFR